MHDCTYTSTHWLIWIRSFQSQRNIHLFSLEYEQRKRTAKHLHIEFKFLIKIWNLINKLWHREFQNNRRLVSAHQIEDIESFRGFEKCVVNSKVCAKINFRWKKNLFLLLSTYLFAQFRRMSHRKTAAMLLGNYFVEQFHLPRIVRAYVCVCVCSPGHVIIFLSQTREQSQWLKANLVSVCRCCW